MNSCRDVLGGIILYFVFFLFPSPVFAVITTITEFPNTISNDPFTITASISGASAGQNYLRIDLFKEGTTNYFGETSVNGSWVTSSEWLSYLPITISSGQVWNGQIQGRIGSPSVTDYDGMGIYKLRVRRYTSSGGTGSESNASAVTVIVSLPTSSPTPTLTVTPSPTPTATHAPTPTKTPSPTPTSAKAAASPITGIQSSATLSAEEEQEATPAAILGRSTGSGTFLYREKKKETVPNELETHIASKATVHPLIFVGFGFLFTACGILAYRAYRRWDLSHI